MQNSISVYRLRILFGVGLGLLISSQGQWVAGQFPKPPAPTSSPSPTKVAVDSRLNARRRETEQRIKAGDHARTQGDYRQAFDAYKKVQELNPKDPRADSGLAGVYADLTCNNGAIQEYLKALEFQPKYAEARVGLAYVYMEEARYDQVREEFQKVIDQAPRNEPNLDVVKGQALLLMKTDRQDEAKVLMTKLLENPKVKDQAAAHAAVGDVYLEGLWNIKEAVNEYKRATVLNPNIPLYYFKLGLAQYHLSLSSMALIPGLNNPERILATAKEANDNIRKAAELHFDPPELHLLLGLILNQQTLFQAAEAEINTFFERIQALEKQLASGQPNCSTGFNFLKAWGHVARGLMSLNQGSLQVEKEKAQEFLQSSISSLKRATQLKEGFSGFYSYLGRAYSIKGEYDLAATNYETALRYAKVKSEKAAVLCELGLLYIQLQKPAAAMDNFEKATQYNPNQVSAFIALGTMYALQGRLDDGIKQIEKAVALEPDKLDARIFLGTARLAKWRLTRNPSDFDQTISLLKEIVASKRDFGAGYLALAMAYAENSKVPEALENFQRAVDYSPKEAQTYFFRGKFYAEVVFNDAAAIESLKQAIELDPNSFEAHGYLGMLYARTGRQPEAIKYLTKAIELRPKSTSAMMFMPNALPSVTDIQQLYFTLAEIHRSRNEFSDAIRILKAASEIPTAQQIGYTALASLYEQTKEYDEAANYYEKAALVSASDAFNWNYFMGRATRLRGRYTDAIGFFRNLASLNPALGAYEIGLTHVRAKNKSEALAQYTQLVQLKSPFAEDLLKQINEMK